MKENSWSDCVESHAALKISPDKARSSSLMETAEARLQIISEVNEKNCNFVFEDYYTSILELLQAMVILAGYKITNHVCLGFYLKEILGEEALYQVFDDVRYKRNALTYYGKRMEFDIAKQAIEKCKKLFRELKKMMNRR